jgi:hypothetical protein
VPIDEMINSMSGVWGRTQEGFAQAADGEGAPLDELVGRENPGGPVGRARAGTRSESAPSACGEGLQTVGGPSRRTGRQQAVIR